MSIKFGVLGLIAERPRHGYAVRAAFEAHLGDIWELNYGQVYQVLTTLEQEGFIVGTGEQVGRRPRRIVYEITANGRDALRVWLGGRSAARRPFRDELFVRLLLAADDPKLLEEILNVHVRRCEQQLDDLSSVREASHGGDRPSRVRSLFAEAAILHAEADLAVLRSCRGSLLASDVQRGAAPVSLKLARSAGRSS